VISNCFDVVKPMIKSFLLLVEWRIFKQQIKFKKLSILSVISLILLRTKKTHTGAVKTGLPMVVGDHGHAELGL